ncbi:hypothetical protein [Nocardioides dilutus]
MTAVLVVVFLISHGLVHLAIWLPHPDPAADRPLPFVPDHSALLTATAAPVDTIHRVAVGAAVAVAAAYVLAATVVGVEAPGAVVVTALAASMGLVQKALFFHPWLSLGVLIDLGVLTVPVAGWPIGL